MTDTVTTGDLLAKIGTLTVQLDQRDVRIAQLEAQLAEHQEPVEVEA